MMKRTISLILILLLAISVFAGCSGDSGSNPTAAPSSGSTGGDTTNEGADSPDAVAGTWPIVTDGSITLEIWFTLNPMAASFCNDLADGTNYTWKTVMERTGINVEFTHPLDATATEMISVMIAGGEYPDILNGSANNFIGGFDQAVNDGVLLRLNELQDEYAPNYMRWVNMSESNQKSVKTDSGLRAVFSMAYDRGQPGWDGYALRQDWLDDLGAESPVTIDDWHNILVAFRDNYTTDGAAPMELASSGMTMSNFFNGAYGVSNNDHLIEKDGKIAYSVLDDGFRQYLETMSGWYAEGLIDPDFVTNGGNGMDPNTTRVSNSESGAVPMMMTYAGTYMADMGFAPAEAYFSLQAIPRVDADTPAKVTMKGKYASLMGGMGAVIFADTKYPVEAVRFLDYFYSDEGMITTNYGVEGITFTYDENGHPWQTDLITHNPEGMAQTVAQIRYLMHNGFCVFMRDREDDGLSEEGMRYYEVWNEIGDWNLSGALTYTPEEGSRRTALMNDINTYIEEFTVKVIMGTIELNDTTYGDFVNQVKSLGADEVVSITQAAFDRFLAR